MSALAVGIAVGVVLVALIFVGAGWADLGQYGEPDQ